MGRIAVIVPVHNGGTDLEKCLAAISQSSLPVHECIVVDDASTDDAALRLSATPGVRLVRLDTRRGPAYARNAGASRAEAEVLLFVDADVRVHPDAIAIAAEQLAADPELTAVFGSYDDRPVRPDFVSRYRNLFHHWVHQSGNIDSASFWSGCGAIRRAVFRDLGGFDPGYVHPGIEDIELGARLRRAGFRVRLEKSMLCTHMKRWTLPNLFKTDLFHRGVPWFRLLLREKYVPRDLNLKFSARLATLFAGLLCLVAAWMLLSGRGDDIWPAAAFLIAAAVCGMLNQWDAGSRLKSIAAISLVLVAAWAGFHLAPSLLSLVPLMLILALVLTHLPFYRFLAGLHGLSFAIAAVPMQLLFFLTCALSIPLGLAAHLFKAGGVPGVR